MRRSLVHILAKGAKSVLNSSSPRGGVSQASKVEDRVRRETFTEPASTAGFVLDPFAPHGVCATTLAVII